MKMLREVVVFCALLAAASAFVEHHPLTPKPDKFKDEPGCYIQELDQVLPVGMTLPSKERCVEYLCSDKEVTVTGCSVVGIRPNCDLVEDTSLPYPDCCPREKC